MNHPVESILATRQPRINGVSSGDIDAVRRQMFLDFCTALENRGIAYVILSGYQDYPDRIDSDIDFMVSVADFERLAALFRDSDGVAGAQLIQFVQHGIAARNYVLANKVDNQVAYLHPDSAFNFRSNGRLRLRSDPVLATRRKSAAGFWIPAAAVEFEYYFIKRVDKGIVEARHLEQLSTLQAEDPEGCATVLARLAPPAVRDALAGAIAGRDAEWFAHRRHELQRMLAGNRSSETVIERVVSRGKEWMRRLRRIVEPTGLVIAILGPDGSGKTTVIEHLERELAPAFRRVCRYHLRPRFGAAAGGMAVTDPHGQKPRGHLASAAKVGLFILDYWVGWLRWVYPAKIRSSLVVFDRYYHDMLVDPARYRLPRGSFLQRWLAPLLPQPDLWLVLHAPPEVLVARKGEVTLESARALSRGYEHQAMQLGATRIDTGRALDETLAEAVAVSLDYLTARTRQRIRAAR